VAAAVRARDWSELVGEVVPAATTVLVTAQRAGDAEELGRALAHLLSEPAESDAVTHDPRTVEVPVRYDGPDLADVAGRLGMSTKEVARRHTAAEHRVGFFGFAPGFAYIDGSPDALALPRRSDPRTRIEAGYVAIAGNQSVIYPGGTPGGWHLIGHTDLQLWNPQHEPPNLLSVGDQVVFREVTPC